MMTWHYGIVRHPAVGRDTEWYGLHEIYVEDGVANMTTDEPITFIGDTPEDLIKGMEMALRDASKYPVMDEIGGK